MSGSATTTREARRRETSRAIVRCAVELTARHGLDGWTMDQLADAAGVSRRTVFNYFPGKVDAVLGPDVEFPPEAVELFRAGGPTGDLVDDVKVLARAILDEDVLGVDRETARQHKRVVLGEPRLGLVVHERFERIIGEAAVDVAHREPHLSATDAQLFVRIVISLFDAAVARMETRPDDALADLLDAAIDDARRLLR